MNGRRDPRSRAARASSARTSPITCSREATRCARSTTFHRRCTARGARRPATSHATSSCMVGDVRDRASGAARARRAWTRSSTSPRRSASARACTRSSTTRRVNNLGTAVLLEALIERPVRAARGRLEHEPLRRGALPRRAAAGRRGARAPARAARRAGDWEPRRRRRRAARARADAGDQGARRSPSVYALSKFDQERLCLIDRPRLRHPHRRAALLQRVRHAAGALEPVHRRARDLRGALPQRPPAARERGRAAAARLRVACTTSRGRACSRSRRRGAPGGVFNVGSGAQLHRASRSPSGSRGCSGKEHVAPEITGKYRVGDIRHCFADISRGARASSATSRGSTFEDGLAELGEWLAGQVAHDRVDARRARSSRRGGSRV